MKKLFFYLIVLSCQAFSQTQKFDMATQQTPKVIEHLKSSLGDHGEDELNSPEAGYKTLKKDCQDEIEGRLKSVGIHRDNPTNMPDYNKTLQNDYFLQYPTANLDQTSILLQMAKKGMPVGSCVNFYTPVTNPTYALYISENFNLAKLDSSTQKQIVTQLGPMFKGLASSEGNITGLAFRGYSDHVFTSVETLLNSLQSISSTSEASRIYSEMSGKSTQYAEDGNYVSSNKTNQYLALSRAVQLRENLFSAANLGNDLRNVSTIQGQSSCKIQTTKHTLYKSDMNKPFPSSANFGESCKRRRASQIIFSLMKKTDQTQPSCETGHLEKKGFTGGFASSPHLTTDCNGGKQWDLAFKTGYVSMLREEVCPIVDAALAGDKNTVLGDIATKIADKYLLSSVSRDMFVAKFKAAADNEFLYEQVIKPKKKCLEHGLFMKTPSEWPFLTQSASIMAKLFQTKGEFVRISKMCAKEPKKDIQLNMSVNFFGKLGQFNPSASPYKVVKDFSSAISDPAFKHSYLSLWKGRVYLDKSCKLANSTSTDSALQGYGSLTQLCDGISSSNCILSQTLTATDCILIAPYYQELSCGSGKETSSSEKHVIDKAAKAKIVFTNFFEPSKGNYVIEYNAKGSVLGDAEKKEILQGLIQAIGPLESVTDKVFCKDQNLFPTNDEFNDCK